MNLLELAPKEALQIAPPKATISYSPVPNVQLLENIQRNIEGRGLTIKGADMKTAAHGQQFMGTIQLGGTTDDAELGMQLGFRNSYNKSFAVGFGIGAEVFICSNGMFLADVKAVRKHTSMVWRDISSILSYQLDEVEDTFTQLLNDSEDMKYTYLSQEQVQEIVWKLWVEEKVLTGQQMNILKKEMFYSENFKMYDPKQEMGLPTAWNMYNNVTQALKVSHPSKYFKDHEKTHQLITEYA